MTDQVVDEDTTVTALPDYVRQDTHLYFMMKNEKNEDFEFAVTFDNARNQMDVEEIERSIEEDILPSLRKEYGDSVRTMTSIEVDDFLLDKAEKPENYIVHTENN